jgi:lipopolysaccharide transport system permease protein
MTARPRERVNTPADAAANVAASTPGGISGMFVEIEPPKRFAWFQPREVWAYRELLYFLTWRDVKVRYKQTLLGGAWAVLQPLALMAVFAVFLGKFLNVPSEGHPYALFVFAGLVPWYLFSQSLVAASDSTTRGADLLSKIYFPRVLLPVSAAAALLLDFVISFALLVVMALAYGVDIGLTIFWIGPLAALCWLAALAAGIWFSALNVRYRDVRHAVPFLVQVWLFLSPIAYPSAIVPERWRWLYDLNPMVGVIDGFRWALLGSATRPSNAVLLAAAIMVGTMITGLAYFQRTQRSFADVV